MTAAAIPLFGPQIVSRSKRPSFDALYSIWRLTSAATDFLFTHPDLRGDRLAQSLGHFLVRQTIGFGKLKDRITVRQSADGVRAVNDGVGCDPDYAKEKLRVLERAGP